MKKIPKWLNFSIGYGSDGMLGEFENKEYYRGMPLPSYKRYRQYYFSLDIDFSEVDTKSKVLTKIFNVLSYIKIPFPTIEFSNNKLKGHFIYF